MIPKQPRRRILPKISTLPRQQTEAASYLDLYKLAIEKKRLLQELEAMVQRQQDIHERLAVVEQQITTLKATAEALDPTLSAAIADPAVPSPPPPAPPTPTAPAAYKTVFLDY